MGTEEKEMCLWTVKCFGVLVGGTGQEKMQGPVDVAALLVNLSLGRMR